MNQRHEVAYCEHVVEQVRPIMREARTMGPERLFAAGDFKVLNRIEKTALAKVARTSANSSKEKLTEGVTFSRLIWR